MMNKQFWMNVLKYVILFIVFFLLFTCARAVYGQETDCIWVFDDNDDPGFYDTFSYTDPQGRDVCKVRIVFHDPAEGDPNGAVFTESGEVNGYTARFSGSSVDVWRSGSPYSISHTRVWVLEAAPPPTEIPPTEIPPTEIPPTDTEVPPPTDTPTYIPPVPTDTATLPPGVTPTDTPTLPPGVTPSATPVTPTLIPPVTNMPPTPEQPGTTPGQPHATPTPNKIMPVTGIGDDLGLWVAAGLGCGLLALLAGILRRAR